MLRAAAAVAPRAVFVCGNTSTAAGLTVSISRDASGGGKGTTFIAHHVILPHEESTDTKSEVIVLLWGQVEANYVSRRAR